VLPEHSLRESEGGGPPDRTGSPYRRAEQRERLRRFAHRCLALAPDERAVRILKLVLVGGWTSRDVARASRGAVSSSRVDSMIHRLRRRLEAEGLALADRSGRRTRLPPVAGAVGGGGRSSTIGAS
jgi:DNA-directed RNA polymerase specialized sigma24 family protein